MWNPGPRAAQPSDIKIEDLLRGPFETRELDWVFGIVRTDEADEKPCLQSDRTTSLENVQPTRLDVLLDLLTRIVELGAQAVLTLLLRGICKNRPADCH